MGYSQEDGFDCSWEEKIVNGCLTISVSAPDSEDVTARVVPVHTPNTKKTESGIRRRRKKYYYTYHSFLFLPLAATYYLKVKSGYPPDGFHSYEPPTTNIEGTFTDLAKANTACRKYVKEQGYSKSRDDSTWEEKIKDGRLTISVSAADSEDVTASVVSSLDMDSDDASEDGDEYENEEYGIAF